MLLTSLSVWCGERVWTLTISPSPTWLPWGTCWALAFWPCASAASHWFRAWVYEFFPFTLNPSPATVMLHQYYLHRVAFDWTIKHFLVFITGPVNTKEFVFVTNSNLYTGGETAHVTPTHLHPSIWVEGLLNMSSPQLDLILLFECKGLESI